MNENAEMKLLRTLIREVIRKCKGGYCLYSKKTGKKLGTHPSKKKAQAQEKAIAISKHGG